MDDRLEKALEFANYRQTLNNQLHKLKIKVEGLLVFAKGGGIFNVNQELICFLDYLIRSGEISANILDSNNTPVHIENLADFLKDIRIRYVEVTDDYLKEYQSIRKLRNVKSIIGDVE